MPICGHFEFDWRRSRVCITSVAIFVWFGLAAHTCAQTVEESQLKAAYLYNLAKFVEWPVESFQRSDSPVEICVAEDERTSDALEQAASGRRVNGRPVDVRRTRSSAQFKACHILFIGFSGKERIVEVLRGLRGMSVLTVGQSGQFIMLGGMINLARKNSTIELEIDPEAATAAGLKISSRLLVVAQLVKAARPNGVER